MTLAAKLVKVMAAVDHVEKSGRNQAQNYDYVKAADVARAIRKACIENGVFITTSITEGRTWEAQTRSGGVMHYCSVSAAFTFHDIDKPEVIGPLTAIGWGSDTGDKAPYKAQTGALKYALRNSFLIPDESDPENESEETTHQTEKHEPSIPQEAINRGLWPTTVEGDVLRCYVQSVTERPGKFEGSCSLEIHHLGRDQKTQVSTKTKFLKKSDTEYSMFKETAQHNCAFRFEQKGQYLNIVGLLECELPRVKE